MSHHDAQIMTAGALDIGILAHRLRQLQGNRGELRDHRVLQSRTRLG